MKKWLLLMLVVVPALVRGDTLKLKDGTTVEGIIQSEDDRDYVVTIEYAGGTITREDRVAKSNVVDVVRFTPEQLLQRDYETTQRYRLDPQTSYPLAQYSETISNVFVAFLQKHPDSPYSAELTQKIRDWQLERDLVASGQTLLDGKWMSAADAAKIGRRTWAQSALRQGNAYLAQGGYESAVAKLHAVGQMTDVADLAGEARQREAAAYKTWLDQLTAQQQQLNNEIQRAGQAAQQPGQQSSSITQTLRSRLYAPTPDHQLGDDAFVMKKPEGVNALPAPQTMSESHVNNLRSQLDALAQKIAEVQARASKVGVASSASTPSAASTTTASSGQPATVGSVEEAQRATAGSVKATDVLDKIVAMSKEYWIVGVGAGLLILWFAVRAAGD